MASLISSIKMNLILCLIYHIKHVNKFLMDEIQNIVSQINQLIRPIKIILFGSVARGEANKNSDIDLLIVMPNGTPKRKTAQLLYSTLSDIKVPYDIIIATPQDLETYKDNIGLVYKTVLEEGKIIYAA
jgi:uncharacterized protein